MPFKSEKIKIAGTKYDRRKRLTDEDRENIKRLYGEGMAIRQIARLYKYVSRRLVQFVLFPERAKIVAERAKEVRRWEKYNEKEYHSPIMRNYRRYKQSLYKAGKIKLESEVERR